MTKLVTVSVTSTFSVMSGDSQVTFSGVRTGLRQRHANCCSICLTVLPTSGAQLTHLLDGASEGV